MTGVVLYVVLLLIAMAPSAVSQIPNVTPQTETPIPGVGHHYLGLSSDVLTETVSPQTGSLSVRINLPVPPSRGLNIPFALVYNSAGVNQLTFDGNSGVASWINATSADSGVGWTYSLPVLTLASSLAEGSNAAEAADGAVFQEYGCDILDTYLLQSVDGSRHGLGVSLAESNVTNPQCNNVSYSPSNPVSSDGEYQTELTGPLNGNGSWMGYANPVPVTVRTKDGTVYKFASNFTNFNQRLNPQAQAWLSYPDSIEDRNGNIATFTSAPGAFVPGTGNLLSYPGSVRYTDTAGRNAVSVSAVNPGTKQSSAAISGLQNPVVMTWGATSSTFGDSSVAITHLNGGNCEVGYPSYLRSAYAIQSITLPNGQTFQFSYDPVYGVLNRITYPTGAYINYTWGLNSQSALLTGSTGGTVTASFGIANGDLTQTNQTTAYCYFQYGVPAIVSRDMSYDGSTIAEHQAYSYNTAWTNAGTPPQVIPFLAGSTTTIQTTDNIGHSAPATEVDSFSDNGFFQGTSIPGRGAMDTTTDKDSSGGILSATVRKWFDPSHQICTATQLDNGATTDVFNAYNWNMLTGYAVFLQPMDMQVFDYGLSSLSDCMSASVQLTGTGSNLQVGTGNAPAGVTPTKETKLAYSRGVSLPNNGYLDDLVASMQIYGNGVLAAETDASYDQNPVTVVSAVQHDSQLAYNSSTSGARGNPTTITSICSPGCNNSVSHYTWDTTGQITSATDGNGNTTNFSHADHFASGTPPGNTNAFLTQIDPPHVNNVSHATNYQYDFASGHLLTATDPNGQTTQYKFNDPGSWGRLTEVDGPPDPNNNEQSEVTSFSYQDAGPNPSVTTSQLLNTAGAEKVNVEVMDGVGHPIESRLTSDPAGTVYVHTTYDGLGRAYQVSNPYRSTSDPTYGITTMTYDPLGRPYDTTNPDGTTHSLRYSGNTTTSIDEVNHQWIRTSDAFGRLTKVLEPNSITGIANLETDYLYDVLGNLRTATQNGNGTEAVRTRNFNYDSLSRLLSSTNPETGTISYGYTSTSGLCAGDVSLPCTKTDARGVVSSYTYDALNRLAQKSYNNGASTILYGYDSHSIGFVAPHGGLYPSVTATLTNAIGRPSYLSVTGTVNPTGASLYAFSYDPMGRMTTQWLATPSTDAGTSPVFLLSYLYDLAGNVTDVTYPDGRHVKQTMDGAGRLSSSALADIGGVPQIQSYLTSASYNPDGSPNVLTLGNGVQQTIVKNNRLQVQGMTVNAPTGALNGATLLSHSYCYVECATGGAANNGNIWGITDTLKAANNQGFTYDSLNRIGNFYLGGTLNQQYAIDSFGNMSGVVGGTAVTSFDPATNRINNLPCAASVTPYDAAGNQLCSTDANGAVSHYSYDAENRIGQIAMLGFESSPFVNYVYDGDGTRIRKNNASGTFTEYVGSGGQTLAEFNSDGSWTDYIYANGQKIAKVGLTSTDQRYRMSGVTVQSGYELSAGAYIPGNQITVQDGDRICWSQYNSNAVGGINLQFFDAQNQYVTQTAWALGANDGYAVNQSFTQGQWLNRSADLSAYAGMHFTYLALLKDVYSPAGSWYMDIKDVTIVHGDGSITALSGASGTVQANDPNWDTSVSLATVTGGASNDSDFARTRYYLDDHLGTAQMELSAGGWPVWAGQFAPFGAELDTQNTAMHYKFTGKERDAESGLDYFGARYYASNMGRWMSPDWADKPEAVPYSDLGNPQSLNLYGYVNNNPLSKADPDGHCPPGQDCGKVTVTATTSGEAPLTTSNGGRTATVEGTVQYKFTYNGKPLTNTQIHEDISNKSSRDGVPEKAKLTTSDGPTGPANNNPPGTIPDTSGISITTPFGGAGATMETSVFSKDTTQTLSFQTPTGSACSVTETRTLSNADSKGQPTDTYNIKLTSPATQKATPVTPPKTPTT